MKTRRYNNIPGYTYLTSATYLGNPLRDMYNEWLKEERKMANKFKVGDMVIGNDKADKKYVFTKKGWIGRVINTDMHLFNCENGMRVVNVKDPTDCYYVDPYYFDLYIPHESKILIMVDEKDPNKIIARDLITKRTAEAKCNPKDEWDFSKGAKLALERLYPEKKEEKRPKYWSGKVVCVEADGRFVLTNKLLFTVGKVYEVKDGKIYDDEPPIPHTSCIKSVDLLNSILAHAYKFVEFKGEA